MKKYRAVPAGRHGRQDRSAIVESLEPRQLMAAIVNESKIKLRNVSANNLSTNQSVLTIPLTEKVTIADQSLIQVRGYAINPLTGGQKKLVVNVTNVEILEVGQSYGLLQITTDRLMRKGGRIYFYSGSLRHLSDNSLVPEQIVRSPKGQNKERFTLASRAFRPTDTTLFNRTAYDVPTPANFDVALSETAATNSLTTFLNKKVQKGLITQAKMDSAMARYNNATTRAIIPDHNLRAAVISLTGTFAEHAIKVFLDGANQSGRPYTILAFDETRDVATISDTEILDNGRLRLRIKPAFQGEPFTALSAVLAHEALHQDDHLLVQEEIIANTFGSVVYAQQLDVEPTVATVRSALVNDENTKLLALLNSGSQSFPIVGPLEGPIRHTDAGGVFYGGKPIQGGFYDSSYDYLRRIYLGRGNFEGDTPGNATLREYLKSFNNTTAAEFKEDTIAKLDRNLYPVLTNPLAVRAAGYLRLTV